MKQFSKSLLAVALLAASAGAANASIAVGNNTTSEAYLSVYDSTQGLTFTLDLGLTFGDLVLNISNDTFSKSYDLAALTAGSANAQWSTFAANLNAATTVYGVVASGTAGRIFATGPEDSPAKFPTLALATGNVSKLANHIATVNTAARADNGGSSMFDPTSLNLSAIISDADTPNTGQHNQEGQFSTLNGGKSDAAADISYGQAGKFYYYAGIAVPFEASQQWTLVGNTLTYAAPVPLPAAVWMFGAGLMGVLGLTRRKNAAV
jgi:hypothetical protein